MAAPQVRWSIIGTRDVAALTSRGYICIAPNPRGSTGYGLDFQKANFQDLGGGDLKDEIAGVDFVKATGYVDPKKIGIYGGSYGGFMTLMAIGKTPDIWAAAVDQYGIINWSSMLKSSDPELDEYLKALLGNPENSRKVYEEDSPITYIRSEKAPLLVLQGDNDPRVPKEEAQQVVEILKKEGRVVDVHYYANEGHGFVKRENQIDSIRRTIAWFDQYLMGKIPHPSKLQKKSIKSYSGRWMPHLCAFFAQEPAPSEAQGVGFHGSVELVFAYVFVWRIVASPARPLAADGDRRILSVATKSGRTNGAKLCYGSTDVNESSSIRLTAPMG